MAAKKSNMRRKSPDELYHPDRSPFCKQHPLAIGLTSGRFTAPETCIVCYLMNLKTIKCYLIDRKTFFACQRASKGGKKQNRKTFPPPRRDFEGMGEMGSLLLINWNYHYSSNEDIKISVWTSFMRARRRKNSSCRLCCEKWKLYRRQLLALINERFCSRRSCIWLVGWAIALN